MPKQRSARKSDLPPGLAAPAMRALSAAGVSRLAQLAKLTEADLARMHGIGPSALRQLRAAMAARGLEFAGAKKARG